MSDKTLNLPREKFEPVISRPIELDRLEATELELCFQNIGGPCNIRTCYGDICRIVNALRDYSRLLRMVCEEWDLSGYHEAVYQLQADILEKISKKYQMGIGYDYDAAVEKCRRKAEKRSPEDDIGEEAMTLAIRKSQRAAEKKNQRP